MHVCRRIDPLITWSIRVLRILLGGLNPTIKNTHTMVRYPVIEQWYVWNSGDRNTYTHSIIYMIGCCRDPSLSHIPIYVQLWSPVNTIGIYITVK